MTPTGQGEPVPPTPTLADRIESAISLAFEAEAEAWSDRLSGDRLARVARRAIEDAGLLSTDADEVLVEDSWFKRADLPEILGRYMRTVTEMGREIKAQEAARTASRSATQAALAAAIDAAYEYGGRDEREARLVPDEGIAASVRRDTAKAVLDCAIEEHFRDENGWSDRVARKFEVES